MNTAATPAADALDRWFDMREHQHAYCYTCDHTGDADDGKPCPTCRPLARRLSIPVVGDVEADQSTEAWVLDRARYLVDHPSVTASHVECRQLIRELYALASQPRPGLTRSDYLMVCAIEEASEIIQRGCKSLRFGAREVQPDQLSSNAERFTGELIDFRAVLELLREQTTYVDDGLLRQSVGLPAIKAKKEKIAKYMVLSRAEGRLQPDVAPAAPKGNA